MASDKPELTQAQLEAWAAEWAPRLFVTHWDVAYSVVRDRDITGMGECSVPHPLTKHVAEIKLIDPIDHHVSNHWPYDYEKTLVHEQLHLIFAPFFDDDKKSPLHALHEQAIDLLARAFVNLKRELTRPNPAPAESNGFARKTTLEVAT